jgi:cytidine deaminase
MKYTFPTPSEGFAVALLTKSDNVFTGESYASDAHDQTMHSETIALTRAANEGETEIVSITGPNCHNCKQLIWKSAIRSKIDTVILVEEGD